MNSKDKKAHNLMIEEAVRPHLILANPLSELDKLISTCSINCEEFEEIEEFDETESFLFKSNVFGEKIEAIELIKNDSEIAPNCNAQDNLANARAVQRIARWKSAAQGYGNACRAINSSSKSCREVERAIRVFNAIPSPITWYRCYSSGNNVINAYNNYIPIKNAAVDALNAAYKQMVSNANRDIAKLKKVAAIVKDARNLFDSSSMGAGTSTIINKHQIFKSEEQNFNQYYFGTWTIAAWDQKFRSFLNSARDVHNEEAKNSTITDLDRLRDEYFTRNRTAPLKSEFTKTKSSANFSFAEINSGTYSWAVISDRLLIKLEALRKGVGNKPVKILSGYRNPAHNDSVGGVSTSRHQYGDASDVCPIVDLTGDGKINKKDRNLIYKEAGNAGFNERIKKNLCVHVATE